jgi:hypothetical protein
MIMRALGAASQLALLVFAVAMDFYGLAVIAALAFLWQGSAFVYSAVSGEEAPSVTQWMTSRMEAVATSDGAWAVAVGVGVVVIICGALFAVVHSGSTGHYVGTAIAAFTGWTLGTMRRARQAFRPEQ